MASHPGTYHRGIFIFVFKMKFMFNQSDLCKSTKLDLARLTFGNLVVEYIWVRGGPRPAPDRAEESRGIEPLACFSKGTAYWR